jgi:ribose transport system substrate-binding protein
MNFRSRLLGQMLAGVAIAAIAATAHAADRKTIGVDLPNLTNPYYVAMKKSFENSAAAHGFNVRVLIADNDDAKQLSQIESFVQQKVDAVALNCTSSGPCVSTVGELNQAKIPVFTVNLLPDPEGLKQQGATVVEAVQTDQREGGVYVGKQLVKDLGPDGAAVIGIIGEPTSVSANARDDGFKDAVAVNRKIKVVALVNGKVEETTSLRVTTEMLQGHPDMTVVFSDTEPAALGAAAAIEQVGRAGKVSLYAYVDKEGVKQIVANPMWKAGAIQEPVRLAEIEVDAIAKYLAGEKVAPLVNSPPLLVDKSNAASVVDKAY